MKKMFLALVAALLLPLGALAQNAPTVKANIAALRANVGAYPAIQISGYYAAGDLGGGLFNLVSTDTTSADNSGSIIVDAAGHRYYAADGAHKVEQWGVVGGDTVFNSTHAATNKPLIDNALANVCG